MDGHLKLTTLGEFTIELNGDPVAGLASRKADALLAYLAVTRRPHAREHLATLLWDDRPLDRSLANLSVVLNSLKKQLAPFLHINRKSIAIEATSKLSVDVHVLTDAIHQWDPQTAQGSMDALDEVKKLDEMLLAYKGEFLQGFHLREARGFDEWVTIERERIQRLVQSSQRMMVEVYLQQGDLDSAIRCLQRSLSIDPLQEDRHRQLMRAFALSGRYTEALAQYQACGAVLSAELGVEPSLETRRVYDRILSRRERPLDNLPSLATTTIGRRSEIAEITSLLLDPKIRLLTLVGPGGIGKTRLALEAALRMRGAFLEGVWLVDFAPLDNPGLVPQAIGRMLTLPDRPAAAANPELHEDVMERLLEFLQEKELLLVFDNCEHLLSACVPIADRFIRHCPQLKVLVTSRERFDLPDEHLYAVEPLAIPSEQPAERDDIERLRENDSIRLFEERARAVRNPFSLNEQNRSTLVRICRTLDGMPLAIELAASRLRSLSLTQIAEKLEESIQNLGRDREGAIPRHQTLETAMDWSYRLLSDDEQQLFRLTTVFRGGFDPQALVDISRALGIDPELAEQILANLVEKSLIVIRDVELTAQRYILLEPVRQFGIKRMQDDPMFERVQELHADYYLRLAERLGPKLHGPQRKKYTHLLELDADNLRAALRSLLKRRRSEECLRFAHALWEGFWLNQGYFTEGRDWVDQVLQISDEGMGYLYGSALLARGAFAWTLGNVDDSLKHVLLALEHGRRIGEARLIQWALYWKASVIFDRSNFSEAAEALHEAYRYAQDAGEARGAAWSVFYQAQIARVKGQTEQAVHLYKEALAVLSELDIFGAGWCFIYLGHLATEQRDLELAREHLARSLEIFKDINNPRGLGGAERGMGVVELEAGNLEKAELHLRRSRRYFDQLGWIKMTSSSLVYLGHIAIMTGRVEEASELLIESLAYVERERDAHSIAHLLFEFGLLAIQRGFSEAGRLLFDLAKKMQRELDVAFPLHVVNAVEEAEQRITPFDPITDKPDLSWEFCVGQILDNPLEWVNRLQTGMHS